MTDIQFQQRSRIDDLPSKKSSCQRQEGMGLVFVFVVSIVLAGLAAFTISVTFSASKTREGWANMSQSGLACESVAELFRNDLVSDYQNSGLTPANWLDEVRNGVRYPSTAPVTYLGFPGIEVVVKRVSESGSGSLWVDIDASTTSSSNANPQGVEQRIKIGSSHFLDFAVLSKDSSCLFCHLNVQGDIGNLSDFNPGWGSRNSGRTSSIDGDIYTSGEAIEGRGHLTGTVNGTDVTGDIYEDYVGEKLPADENANGEIDFPTIHPVIAAQNAKGKLWAGDSSNSNADGSGIWVTPLLGSWDRSSASSLTSAPSDQTGTTWKPADHSVLGSTIEGNVTLVGTDSHPIQISGDVFISGDVVIKGKVSGQGSIYAGRNVYIAGDILYSDGPSAMTNDSDAVTALAQNKDEFRIAARSNVILGDWTYREDDDSLQKMRERQTQTYITSTLNLNDERYFLASDGGISSSELTLIDGKYYDDQGNEIPDTQVITISDSDELTWAEAAGEDEDDVRFDSDLEVSVKPDNYDSVIAPAQVQSDGTLHRWLNQEDFREILGTSTYKDMLYRYPTTDNDDVNSFELGRHGRYLDLLPEDTAYYDRDYYGERGLGQYIKKTDEYVYIVETGSKEWPTHITRVDAFLYGNQRVVGVTPQVDGLVINGGVAAKNIEILAPGRGNLLHWFTPADYGNRIVRRQMSFRDESTPGLHGDLMNGFFLNYDYRLRNGGKGLELMKDSTGDRMFFIRVKG